MKLAAAAGGCGSGLKKGTGSFDGVSLSEAAAGADVGVGIRMPPTGRRAAKQPEGLVGAVLGGEDVDVELGLACSGGAKDNRVAAMAKAISRTDLSPMPDAQILTNPAS